MADIKVVCGDCLEVLRGMGDGVVDCCVTSPPYWSMRDYGVEGQIGLERHPFEYISRLVEVFRQVRRILRVDGTLWLNLGDTYISGRFRGIRVGQSIDGGKVRGYVVDKRRDLVVCEGEVYKDKDLGGIPWRVALALQEDGWWLRQDIIWHKTNCLPESVKDRCVRCHEYIFLLSKSSRYYFDYSAIMELSVSRGGWVGGYRRRRRSVWSVSVETRAGDGEHFAAFPEKLVLPCILAGSREGGLVMDPFMGTGTVGVVAVRNNRKFIGIDISDRFCDIARRRIRQAAGIFCV